jgi:hypothetical protein
MGTFSMAKGLKDPCHHVAGVGGGGQYKMYNSLIFINFISRSKKWNQKSKSCIKRLYTVNKPLRLWYFVSVLNLKFLDQLERRHCKDTPFFRAFYIGAPKGPFLWGLRSAPVKHSKNRSLTLPCIADHAQSISTSYQMVNWLLYLYFLHTHRTEHFVFTATSINIIHGVTPIKMVKDKYNLVVFEGRMLWND